MSERHPEIVRPVFCSRLPGVDQVIKTSHPQAERIIAVCDKKLQSLPVLRKWKHHPKALFYFVSAGEREKSIERLPFHFERILSLTKGAGKEKLLFASFGGGSLGDLTGFLAGIYNRGAPLVFFPTTRLSALDSAHGGKNGLNFKKIKNVAGLYWFPKNVFIVRDFFKNTPEKENLSAFGELLKTALIKGGTFYSDLRAFCEKTPPLRSEQQKHPSHQKTQKNTLFWETFLKQGIAVKREIVRKDPFETKGLRRKLNLGHTLGHILESATARPHGPAVLDGIVFSARWSFQKSFLSRKHLREIEELALPHLPKKRRTVPLNQFKHFLDRDKKHRGGRDMDFIFIRRPGRVFIRPVSQKDIIKEARRQGWISKP